MLKTLSALLDSLSGSGGKPPPADDRQLLAASLIVDCAMADGALAPAEREMLRDLVGTYTGLEGAEADAFLARAEERAAQEGDFAAVAADLGRSLGDDDRRLLLALMWRVALADGRLHEFEEALVERVGALLGLGEDERRTIRTAAGAE